MALKDKTNCWHCDEQFSFFGQQQCDLLGGAYVAVLCAECRNLFDVFVQDHPKWREWIALSDKAEMTIAQTCGDGQDRIDDIERIREQKYALRKELKEIASTWVRSEE